MPKVLTVILNWRTPDMTLRSVQAALTAMQGIDGAITVVDNDSQDGSFEQMAAVVHARGWDRATTPVQVVQAGWNGGFGAGNNVGIRAGLPGGARPDFVYILNSDAFPAPDAIRCLLDHLLAHPATGFAGSHIHGPEGDAHHTAFRFPSVAGEFEQAARFGPVSRLLRRFVVAPPLPLATTQVDWLAGASLMMRQDVLDQIGLFDETYFLYFEETDLCLRAARAGWPTDYVVESRVAHIGSVSTGMKEWQRIPGFWLDSRHYYYVKNHGTLKAAMATLAHLAGGLIWRLRALVQRRDVIDPPHYLTDLASHAARVLLRPIRPRPTDGQGISPSGKEHLT
ncbi:glycosyltransferase family 2 protein [Pseudotabrizicola sp. L79]|uniref:glycosyltransferase family 2 protein n=1 Tax=Pseudotabrizicola sp. L79 TaxID=3118402 RepID=UPI002F949B9A